MKVRTTPCTDVSTWFADELRWASSEPFKTSAVAHFTFSARFRVSLTNSNRSRRLASASRVKSPWR